MRCHKRNRQHCFWVLHREDVPAGLSGWFWFPGVVVKKLFCRGEVSGHKGDAPQVNGGISRGVVITEKLENHIVVPGKTLGDIAVAKLKILNVFEGETRSTGAW